MTRWTMPAILVRNISEKAHKALKERAKLHGTSAEAEVRAMVEGIAEPKAEVGLGKRLAEISRKHGAWFDDFKRDPQPSEPATFE